MAHSDLICIFSGQSCRYVDIVSVLYPARGFLITSLFVSPVTPLQSALSDVCSQLCGLSATLRLRTNVISMLIHRLRRWPNVETTFVQCTIFYCGYTTIVLNIGIYILG